jgi:hypothetical protein
LLGERGQKKRGRRGEEGDELGNTNEGCVEGFCCHQLYSNIRASISK